MCRGQPEWIPSVCRPAAYCGIACVKPTSRSLPAEGIVPLATSFDTVGVYGRTLAEAAAGYAALAGAGLPPARLDPLRIGLVADPLYERAVPSVRAALDDAARRLAEAGHLVARVVPPTPLAELTDLHGTVMAYETAALHGAAVRARGDRMGPRFREFVSRGQAIPPDRYEAARRAMVEAAAATWRAFAGCDLLLAPSVPAPAPAGLGSTGDPTFVTPWTLLGGPLVVAPVGADPAGLPLAIMLAAPPGADEAG